MNRMAKAAAKHAMAVREVTGEPLRLVPQGQTGRSGGVTAAKGRKTEDFVGTVTRRPVVIQRQGAGAQGGTNVQLADAKWQVSFEAPLALTLKAQAGDWVERLDPPPGEPARLRLSEPLPIRGRVIHPANEV